MNLQEYIKNSILTEADNIGNTLPPDITEKEKKVTASVLAFVKSKAIAVLEKNPDFDWGDFDEFCGFIAELVDSRLKREGSDTTGIGYEQVYQKNNIEWLLEIFQDSLGKHEKHILTAELVSLFQNVVEEGESLCVADIASKKPHLYKRLVKFLRISSEDGLAEWKKIRFLLPENMRSAFVLEKLTEEQVEKNIQELIKNRDLEKIIVDHGNYPRKMAFLLRLLHPDLTEEQIRLIAGASFRGLNERSESLYEKFIQWPEELSPLEIDITPMKKEKKDGEEKDEDEKNVFIASGIAPHDCQSIFVYSSWAKRVKVEPGKPFSFFIKVKPGHNDIGMFSVNESDELRSEVYEMELHGIDPIDHDESLVRLLATIKNLKEKMEMNEEQKVLVMEALELTFIKHFSYQFSDGSTYVLDMIKKYSKDPTITNLLYEVLRKFKRIQETNFKGLRTDTDNQLMFFQKYAAYRINQLRDKWLLGVILALEPGLGKTITALVAGNGDEMLIVCPNSIVSGWKEEATKFLDHESMETIHEMSMKKRIKTIEDCTKQCIVTNLQSIQQLDNDALFDAMNTRRLPNESKTVIFDEAHFLKNYGSNQSKWAKQLEATFFLWLTASPFKNAEEFRLMMHALMPKDPRFMSKPSFKQSFPANKVESLRLINQLKREYVIRFLKEDVMREFDPALPLDGQNNRLPKKLFFAPTKKHGEFTLLPEQAEAIELLMTDFKAFEEKFKKNFPKDELSQEDRSRIYKDKNHLAKKQAYRQVVNNPKYIGLPNVTSPKHKAMDAIVEREMKLGNKVVIFCNYQNQVEEYEKRYATLKPSIFNGETSKEWLMKDDKGKTKFFKVDAHKEWVFDAHGYPIEEKWGEPMSAMDYERLTFQHTDDRKLIITTFKAGAVGTTFTRGGAMIYDDLPDEYTQAYQSEDRIHRIDNTYKKYDVHYYYLGGVYPEAFLEESKKKIIVEYDENGIKTGETTHYRRYFRQGTYDQVHYQNLAKQRIVFRLINDEVEDASLIDKLNVETFWFFSGSPEDNK